MLHPSLLPHLQRFGAAITPLASGGTLVRVPGADYEHLLQPGQDGPELWQRPAGSSDPFSRAGSWDEGRFNLLNRADEHDHGTILDALGTLVAGESRTDLGNNRHVNVFQEIGPWFPPDLHHNVALSNLGPDANQWAGVYLHSHPEQSYNANGERMHPLVLQLAKEHLTDRDATSAHALADAVQENHVMPENYAAGRVPTPYAPQIPYRHPYIEPLIPHLEAMGAEVTPGDYGDAEVDVPGADHRFRLTLADGRPTVFRQYKHAPYPGADWHPEPGWVQDYFHYTTHPERTYRDESVLAALHHLAQGQSETPLGDGRYVNVTQGVAPSLPIELQHTAQLGNDERQHSHLFVHTHPQGDYQHPMTDRLRGLVRQHLVDRDPTSAQAVADSVQDDYPVPENYSRDGGLEYSSASSSRPAEYASRHSEPMNPSGYRKPVYAYMNGHYYLMYLTPAVHPDGHIAFWNTAEGQPIPVDSIHDAQRMAGEDPTKGNRRYSTFGLDRLDDVVMRPLTEHEMYDSGIWQDEVATPLYKHLRENPRDATARQALADRLQELGHDEYDPDGVVAHHRFWADIHDTYRPGGDPAPRPLDPEATDEFGNPHGNYPPGTGTGYGAGDTPTQYAAPLPVAAVHPMLRNTRLGALLWRHANDPAGDELSLLARDALQSDPNEPYVDNTKIAALQDWLFEHPEHPVARQFRGGGSSLLDSFSLDQAVHKAANDATHAAVGVPAHGGTFVYLQSDALRGKLSRANEDIYNRLVDMGRGDLTFGDLARSAARLHSQESYNESSRADRRVAPDRDDDYFERIQATRHNDLSAPWDGEENRDNPHTYEDVDYARGAAPAAYAGHEDVAELLRQLSRPEHAETRRGVPGGDWNFRQVVADALRDTDRHQEADWTADPRRHVIVRGGQVWPARYTDRHLWRALDDLHAGAEGMGLTEGGNHFTATHVSHNPPLFAVRDEWNNDHLGDVHPSEAGPLLARHAEGILNATVDHAADVLEELGHSPEDVREALRQLTDQVRDAPYEEIDHTVPGVMEALGGGDEHDGEAADFDAYAAGAASTPYADPHPLATPEGWFHDPSAVLHGWRPRFGTHGTAVVAHRPRLAPSGAWMWEEHGEAPGVEVAPGMPPFWEVHRTPLTAGQRLLLGIDTQEPPDYRPEHMIPEDFYEDDAPTAYVEHPGRPHSVTHPNSGFRYYPSPLHPDDPTAGDWHMHDNGAGMHILARVGTDWSTPDLRDGWYAAVYDKENIGAGAIYTTPHFGTPEELWGHLRENGIVERPQVPPPRLEDLDLDYARPARHNPGWNFIPPTVDRPRTARQPPRPPFPAAPVEYGADDERLGFETSIQENPWDGTAHGVYADWLDEQGHHEEAMLRRGFGDYLTHDIMPETKEWFQRAYGDRTLERLWELYNGIYHDVRRWDPATGGDPGMGLFHPDGTPRLAGEPPEQLSRYDRGEHPAAYADKATVRALLHAARENPYEETVHAELADALEDLYPDSPVPGLIRRQFGFGEHAGAGPRFNLYHDPFYGSWDGTFPHAAYLGDHGPFDFHLAHESPPYQPSDLAPGRTNISSPNSRWIVHAVSRFPETNDSGCTFEFPHEEAHHIPRLFPMAGAFVSHDPDMKLDSTNDPSRRDEAERFGELMDQQERGDYATPDTPTNYAGPEAQHGFWDAINANPFESAHHHAYADWLEEQGQEDEAAFRRSIANWMERNPPEHVPGFVYTNVDGEMEDRPWHIPDGFHGGRYPEGVRGVATNLYGSLLDRHGNFVRDAGGYIREPDEGHPVWVTLRDDVPPEDPGRLGMAWPTYHDMENSLHDSFMDGLARKRQEEAAQNRGWDGRVDNAGGDEPTHYGMDEDLAEFMRQMGQNPEDATARAVFADWLEENAPHMVSRQTLDFLRGHKGRAWSQLVTSRQHPTERDYPWKQRWPAGRVMAGNAPNLNQILDAAANQYPIGLHGMPGYSTADLFDPGPDGLGRRAFHDTLAHGVGGHFFVARNPRDTPENEPHYTVWGVRPHVDSWNRRRDELAFWDPWGTEEGEPFTREHQAARAAERARFTGSMLDEDRNQFPVGEERYARDEHGTYYSDPPAGPLDHPDHVSFLNAIRANPDEPTNALVYADWLDENGLHALSHVIRRHVAAEVMDDHDRYGDPEDGPEEAAQQPRTTREWGRDDDPGAPINNSLQYAGPEDVHRLVARHLTHRNVPPYAVEDALRDVGHPLVDETLARAAALGISPAHVALHHLHNPALVHRLLTLPDDRGGLGLNAWERGMTGAPHFASASYPLGSAGRQILGFLGEPEEAEIQPPELAMGGVVIHPSYYYPMSRLRIGQHVESPIAGVAANSLRAVVRPRELPLIAPHLRPETRERLEEWHRDQYPEDAGIWDEPQQLSRYARADYTLITNEEIRPFLEAHVAGDRDAARALADYFSDRDDPRGRVIARHLGVDRHPDHAFWQESGGGYIAQDESGEIGPIYIASGDIRHPAGRSHLTLYPSVAEDEDGYTHKGVYVAHNLTRRSPNYEARMDAGINGYDDMRHGAQFTVPEARELADLLPDEHRAAAHAALDRLEAMRVPEPPPRDSRNVPTDEQMGGMVDELGQEGEQHQYAWHGVGRPDLRVPPPPDLTGRHNPLRRQLPSRALAFLPYQPALPGMEDY